MSLRSLLRLLACALSAITSHAAEVTLPAADPVLELPKYTVTDQLQLPKPESWRYARIPGFEVLSSASPANTQFFLREFRQLEQVIDVVWPPLRQSPPVPGTMVLYEGGRTLGLLEADVQAIGDDIIEFTPLQPVGGQLTSRFYGNDEGLCIVVNLNREDAREQFFRAYIRYLFTRLDVSMAPWLREGMARLFAGVVFSPQGIKFAGIDPDEMDGFMRRLGRSSPRPSPDAWSRMEAADNTPSQLPGGSNFSEVNASLGPFPSLAEMLEADEAGIKRANGNLAYLAHAFVHLCLYGRGQHYQKPFLTYVARTNGGRGSEEVFRECFGMSVKAMQDEILGYVESATYKTVIFRPNKGEAGLQVPPAVELRSATQAEIGRIKGEGLILAGRADIARLPLLAPYIRGEHDADLLASLGLYELQADRKEQARKLLELATRGGTKRARAYLELAQLRRAELPADRASGATPPAAVMELARKAATLEPQIIEVYELIASEWLQCSAPPPASDLALLEKGAVRFQRKLKLVYDTARLQAAGGQPERAARLASWGAKNAPAARDRERFTQLLATLPAK